MKQCLILALFGLSLASAAQAEDYTLTLKDNHFSPTELTIPADKKVKVTVKNLDKQAAEFESHDLKREKIVKGNDQITVFVGPLKAGRYEFFDDFHKDSAKGAIIAQ